MDSLDANRNESGSTSTSGAGDIRGLTRSALGPLVGESSSDDHDDVPPRNFSRSSYVIDDRAEDDLDDEITAVFNEETEDCMSKSWHGSRSSSQRSLAFFVDLNSSGGAGHPEHPEHPEHPPGINRSMSHSGAGRRVSSARARTRAGSCSTAFFVDLSEGGSGVRSTSRLESSAQLTEMSSDISHKSQELLAKNLQQSQVFFTKLKAFIDFLNMPNYSKEEVRQKKVLADKITRVMFEEEQRLRRGMDLSELKNLDKILNVKNIRPNSAYAAMQNTHSKNKAIKDKVGLNPPETSQVENSNADHGKPILRRERTFDMEHGSVLNKELKLIKRQNRNSMPVSLIVPIIDDEKHSGPGETVRNGWMKEDRETFVKEESTDPWRASEEFNLLKYFQQQRLEHTRLLRKEISRLENLENVYLSALKKSNLTSSKKSNINKSKESCDIRKSKKPNVSREKELTDRNRNETVAKFDKKVPMKTLSNNAYNSFHDRYKQRSTTSFKEVADRKKRNEGCCSILPPSHPNSPSSWYIPSDPPTRSQSNNSVRMPSSRQNSVEMEASPPPQMSTKENQTDVRSRTGSVSNHPHSFGWTGQTGHGSRQSKARHFGQMYPSRQASQDSEIPPPRSRGIQTGNSLLRMYMKKADKGQQVCDRPQAFFLPLDQTSEKSEYIDLETSTDKEATDLQEALRKKRPDYIAAAEERAGRLSRNNEDKKQGNPMTRSTEIKPRRSPNGEGGNFSKNQMKRSQSTPRVNSILKTAVPVPVSQGKHANMNKQKVEKKTVTIVQNGEPKKQRSNVAVLKSRPVNQQHFNLKNIYAPEGGKGLKGKVC